MKTSLLLGATLLLAGGLASNAADTVELNGITCLPGEKLACFLLYQPAHPQPLNFTLAEGESQFGFKLLAVDAPAHRVLVEKCGVQEYLRIGTAPELVTTAMPEAVAPGQSPGPDGRAVDAYFASDGLQRIQAGNPTAPGATAGAFVGAGKSSASGQSAVASNTSSQNSAIGTAADTVSSRQVAGAAATSAGQNDYANQLWYQESLSIEQSRAQTADQVFNGRMTPFPRTPLTPPGTPAQLVGSEIYFANYIPGYKVTGSLDQ